MKEYIRGDGNNSLWLMEENDNDIIYPAKAIITNQTIYNELLDELKNMSSYVLQENKHITDSVMSITNDEHIIYYVDGHAVKYGETYDHDYYERGTKCVERRRSMSRCTTHCHHRRCSGHYQHRSHISFGSRLGNGRRIAHSFFVRST